MIGFILKNVKRDMRIKEVKILFFMLLFSAFILSSTHEINVLLKNKINVEGAKILGADLILKSSYPIEEKFKEKANNVSLKTSSEINFFTMMVAKSKFLLVNVNAITSPFPLNNKLSISLKNGQTVSTQNTPTVNEIWVAEEVLQRLSVQLGDYVSIGENNFKITALIRSNLNPMGDFINFSPQVIINKNDLAKTASLKKGSRASYQLLVSGRKSNLELFKTYFQQHKNIHQSLIMPESTNLVKGVYQTIMSFINLGIMFAVMLAVIAIGLALKRYCYLQLRSVALMRTFGHPLKTVLLVHLGSLRVIGFLAIISGIVLSVMLKPLFCQVLSIDYQQEPFLSPYTFIFTMFVLLVLLILFSFINFSQLRRTETASLFRYHMPAIGVRESLLYLVSFFIILVAVYYLTSSIKLSGMFFYVLLLIFLVSYATLFLCLKCSLKYSKHLSLLKTYIFKVVDRCFFLNLLQVFAISVALTMAFCIWGLQLNLRAYWQQLVFNDVPNVFLINLDESDIKPLESLFSHYKTYHSDIYPMVRGRVKAINGVSVDMLFKNKKKPRALMRELNFTTMDKLPDNNEIIAGKFTPYTISHDNSVSVESSVAAQLGLTIGDEVLVSILSEEVSAKVTSIRKVSWGSFKPNFFMVFNPSALKEYPKTFITSFFQENERASLLKTIIDEFPNVTVIDVSQMIHSVQGLLISLQYALALLVLFSLISAAFIIILIFLMFDLERQKEARTLSLIGLNLKKIYRLQRKGPIFIAVIAGLSVSISSFLSNFVITKLILKVPFSLSIGFFLYPILSIVLLMGFLHWLAMKFLATAKRG